MSNTPKTIDQWLDEVDYKYLNSPDYSPSPFALKVLNFIKLITEGEKTNKTPPVHLAMLDKLQFRNSNYIVNLACRGIAKTTLFGEYLPLYLACFGVLPKVGEIDFMMYVAGSVENGAKTLRQNLESRYNNSHNLQVLLPEAKFTDSQIEFKNKDGRPFMIKLFGVTAGIRGQKAYGKRPQLCHARGTWVKTESGWHPVEEYPKQAEARVDTGIKVRVATELDAEVVTREHRYWVASLVQKVEYRSHSKGTRRVFRRFWIEPRWVEAQDLKTGQEIEPSVNQTDYIVGPTHPGIETTTHIDSSDCLVRKGGLYKRVTLVEATRDYYEFIPIETPSHKYETAFGISHNCIIDDVFTDEAARSEAVRQVISDTIYNGVVNAMDPTGSLIVLNGTPFNKQDILIQAVESGAWDVNVYPVCERFPCSPEEFSGAWPDRFSYKFVKERYDLAIKTGKKSSFFQELMLRLTSAEDRLVQDEDIGWYERKIIIGNLAYYNIFITTDFATSSKNTADFSVISVWALNSNGDWFWIDGICKKQTMDANIEDLFTFVTKYRVQSVGVEVTGQQGAFIAWLKKEQISRNIFFSFASGVNSTIEGIRPTVDKLARFNMVVPLFKMHKMNFPKEWRQQAIMKEFMGEISMVTADGIKGHDDCLDTISMLAQMKTWKPTVAPPALGSKKPKEPDVYSDEWVEEEPTTRWDSYIV